MNFSESLNKQKGEETKYGKHHSEAATEKLGSESISHHAAVRRKSLMEHPHTLDWKGLSRSDSKGELHLVGKLEHTPAGLS